MSSSGGSSGTGLVASFVADEPSPTTGEVTLAQGATNGDMITVEVRLTGISGVRSAEFDLLYDPSALEFIGDTPGTALEASGLPVIYVAGTNVTGVVTVAADIAGPSTVNVSGTRPLVGLIFRLRRSGTNRLDFQGPQLRDAASQTINSNWFGGSVNGS
jgi:hypothetical protein